MKNYVIILFSGLVLLSASCAQHKTCPTYTKNTVKYNKVSSERI